jgi:hypothetical protein
VSPQKVVVSRHPAAIAFFSRALGAQACVEPCAETGCICQKEAVLPGAPVVMHLKRSLPDGTLEYIPVVSEARVSDVLGRHIFGNIPLHLAAWAARVTAVTFAGVPPRGAEYTLAQMDAAGALLETFEVTALDEGEENL